MVFLQLLDIGIKLSGLTCVHITMHLTVRFINIIWGRCG